MKRNRLDKRSAPAIETCEQLRKMLANRRGRWGLNRALTPGVGSGPNCACSLPKGKSQVAR